ncbi:Hypothetical predicted protein [Paramuricea clavata]|uniref:Uncharacterized protein n=1 Tax=Paramuricea clavata TaxID=317549 RepID=A0A7D9HKH8_PARCT|nr:Hypothetical predicted protein [Paramuricea clavata]
MDPYYASKPRHSQKRRRSGTALFSLVLLGCGIVFFGIVMIACAFVINYAEDFEVDTDGGIEAAVQGGFTYSQYWAGIPFLVTGVLVICSGTFQHNRGLTITTVIFAFICVALTLFIISLDGTNWHKWSSLNGEKRHYDSLSGVDCETENKKCACKASTGPKKTFDYECDEISELSSLYGAVVGASIVVAVFCVFSILIVTKSLSWKRIRYGHHRSYYQDDFHMEPARGPPSMIEMPYAKRGEFLEGPPPTGPPYKQTVYRNYPY